jgi:UDP-N-acetylmuramyl pentapeptide phosphotransferase/UDP-N-acetylglucosamine-1-phosphate transferase
MLPEWNVFAVVSYCPPLVSIAVSALLTAYLPLSGFGKVFLDTPNERSLHRIPTPRLGGIGVVTGVLSGWTLSHSAAAWWLILPLMGLFAISLLDDLYRLPVSVRLFTQLVAAALLVAGSGLLTQQGILVALLVLLCTVWMTNLYNFMDGSDGLAGGMAVSGFSCFGIAAWLAGNNEMAVLNFTISGSALGFLYFNFPQAKVFLGDSGAIPLGFLAMAMGLWGWQQDCWEMWFPLLVFSPFIVDATVTLIRRTLHGAKVTEAHREHYYQRAVQLGWSHRKVACIEYALMLAVGMSSLAAVRQTWPWQMLTIWAAIYLVLLLTQDARWKKRGL